MRSTLLFLGLAMLGGTMQAQERPITSLPYTPSLDITAMDRTANPCVDFFQYACGGWNKKNPIPPDQARWEVYSKMTDENTRFLWGILEGDAKPREGRNPVQQKIGDYFAACMAEPDVEKAGLDPLKPALDSIAALKSTRELAPLMALLHQQGQGRTAMFGFGSGQDFEDSNSMIAFVNAGGLGLPDRDYYTKTDPKSVEIRQKYVEHVARMLKFLGLDAGAAQIMAMETDLAKASLTRVEQRDPYKLKHKLTVAQLAALAPSFDWTAYIQARGLRNPPVLNVSQPEFIKQLEVQLKSRSLDDWKTYLRWHVLHASAPYLASRYVNENFEFYAKYLRGVPQLQPRWKRCVQLVDHQLGEALGEEFVARTMTPETKVRTLEMTKQVEAAMASEIKELPWMGPETRKQALVKLYAVVNKIGYPDKWRDYSSILIDRTGFAGNVRRATEFESRRDLAKIGKPVDRTEWDMTPPTVNAYYDPQMNDINFPAGVLQPPLFDLKMDDAPNYGNTGATIGHELTHGFDDEGRQFDAQGNLRDWWTKEDAAEFEKRTRCIEEQYAQYTVIDDIKINSKLTLGEDVADLGGTLLAYIAWTRATESKKLQPIDGFTPDQRFFIGMAQWACGSERPESKRAHAITDPHSPNEFRINGVVANIPEFGKAFACKPGQPMMREKICKVW
jgi:endothelin-converting enzyme/putative endopeptidase